MGESGNPAKQPRPDGQPSEAEQAETVARLASEITTAFPPAVSGVVTMFEAKVVPFAFIGGKALDLTFKCGPLECHLHFDPEFAEQICSEIMDAARKARSNVQAASMADVANVARQANGVKA